MKRSTFIKWSVPVLAIDFVLGSMGSRMSHTLLQETVSYDMLLGMSSLIVITGVVTVHGNLKEDRRSILASIYVIVLGSAISLVWLGYDKGILLAVDFIISVINWLRYLRFVKREAK